MALYLETSTGVFELYTGEQLVGTGKSRGRQNAAALESLWTESALSSISLYQPVEADPVPEGKLIASTSVKRVDGVVKYVHALEDEPVYTPETPQLYALATMTIADGAVASIVPSAQLAGGFRLDTGVYWVFFAEIQQNTNYQVLCFNHAARVYVSERYEDFFVITAEADGVPTDPGNICIQITRVV